MGVGWNLGGLQRITRGPATVAKDGFYDPVDFDGGIGGATTDRFFLDGERLVCVSGTYGMAGSEYRTEIDSYGRITYLAGDFWKVETKAGLIVILGGSVNSQVVAPTYGTLSWGVNRVSDTLGNYYEVEYARGVPSNYSDIINFRVQRISYTGNNTVSPYCHIEFTYKTRTDNTLSYTTHASFRSDALLDKIWVKTGSYINHTYTLGYENSYQTGRSFLKTIGKSVNDTNPVPPTRFTYDGIQDNVPNVNPLWGDTVDVGLPQLMQDDGKDTGVAFLDLNADGLPDFSTWRAKQFVQTRPTTSQPAGDYPVTTQSGGDVYINSGLRSFAVNNSFRPPEKLPLGVHYGDENVRKFNDNHRIVAQPVDVNGDGKLDLMGSVNIRRQVFPSTNLGAVKNDFQFFTYENGSWQPMAGWDLPFTLANDNEGSDQGDHQRTDHFQFADINSDGYQDLLVHTSVNGLLLRNGNDLPNEKGTVYINKGKDGPGWKEAVTAALPKALTSKGKDIGRRLVDLNGDGSPEFLKARYQTGDGLVRETQLLRDRRDGTFSWLPGASRTGNYPYDLPEGLVASSDNATPAMLLDVNGDGLVDMIHSSRKDDNGAIDNWTSLNRGSRTTNSITDKDSWKREVAPNNWAEQDNSYTFPYRLFHDSKEGTNPTFSIAHGFEAADLNGDGLVDFFYSDCADGDADNVEKYTVAPFPNETADRNCAIINTGDGWKRRGSWGNPGDLRYYSSKADRKDGKRNIRLQDIDGDGFPDMITGIRNSRASDGSGGPRVRFNKCRPEVLTSVTDGLGAGGNGNTLTVEYKRLNDPATHTPFGTGSRIYEKQPLAPLTAGQSSVIDARLVVSRYTEPDGRGGQRWRAQRYGDLRYDRKNEASLGFGWMEAKDEFNSQVNYVKYAREYPFAGSPILNQTTIYVADHQINGSAGIPGLTGIVPGITRGAKCLSTESSTYAELASTPGVGGTVRRPVQTRSVSTSFDMFLNAVALTTTEQTFDSYGFVTSSKVTSLDNSTVTTTSAYNHNVDPARWHLGRLSSSTVVKAGGGRATITKNSAFTYDSGNGLLKSETVEPGSSFASSKSYTHDAFGNVIATAVSATGLTTRTSRSAYDSAGRFMTSQTDTLGHTVSFAYDPARALLASSTDIVGRATTLEYDAYGTLIRTNLPDGSQIGESTGFATNSSLPPAVAGHVVWNPIVFYRAKQTSGLPVGKAYFDALGREIVNETTILRNAYNTGADRYSKIYTVSKYDDLGRKVITSLPFSLGEQVHFTTIHMDLINRVLKVDHPDGTFDKTETLDSVMLNGQRHSYSKVRNRSSGLLERWEDTHGRLVQSKDPSGQITTFHHDAEGRLLHVKIDGTQLLTNTFDLLGNKISVTEVNSGTSSSAYNAYGEVVSSTNAKNQTTNFTYDSAGRTVSVVKPGTEGTFTTDYHVEGKALGKPFRTSNGRTGLELVREEIFYDDLARPVTTSKSQLGETFTTATKYDKLGRPHAQIDAGGLILVHQYDSLYSFATRLEMGPGKVGATVGTDNKLLWEAGVYDSSGRATKYGLANGVGIGTSYDSRNGNVTAIAGTQNNGNPTHNGIKLQTKSYEWDSLGNLTKRIDAFNGRVEDFNYDEQNRVISATTTNAGGATTVVPPPASFTYAKNGNLLTKSGASLTYGHATRLHAVTAATVKGAARNYTYDAAGYLTADSKRTYTWSSFGQIQNLDYLSAPALQNLAGLQIFAASRVQSDFTFDAGGNRAHQKKQRIGADGSRQIEETVYLGSYEREIHAAAATSTASPQLRRVVHRHNIGGFLTYTQSEDFTATGAGAGSVTKLTNILKDHLGSTDALYTATWNGSNFADYFTEHQSFDPWAERRAADTHINFRVGDGDAFCTSATDYDRGYTGHEQLDDSGLIHMNGRLYDPELGRMLSPDPYVQIPEFSQNFNRYSYVLNNPLNLTDPSGFSFWGKTHNAFSSWLKQNWRTVVVIVVVAVLTICTAGAFIGAAGVVGSAFATAGVAATATTAATAGSLTMLGGAVVGAIGGAVGGGLSAALAGGDFGDVLRGAAIGAVQGAITGGVLHGMGEAANTAGFFSAETAAHVAGHGVVGGASNAAMGGKFSDGFYSAAAGAAASYFGPFQNTKGAAGVTARTVQAGLVGGTASVIGGGKFANGAYTAALQHLLNAEGGKTIDELTKPNKKLPTNAQLIEASDKFQDSESVFPDDIMSLIQKRNRTLCIINFKFS